MPEGLANLDAVVARGKRSWRPPPKLTLSEWADTYFMLSAESAAQPGRWKTLPYQRGIMDAITDPAVEHVTVMKSARVGYTLAVSAAIGYFMHQDPSSMLVVQPTVEDAKNFSKETIATMLRDVPVLSRIVCKDVEEKGPKDSSNTLTHKAFPGGVLSLVGANSGAGFRRISRRVVLFDEVDAYPPSAGSEGDPIRLGKMRTQAFWNRKIVDGSTPLIAGHSRIEELFEDGDQRRFYVPCPHCGAMAPLVFSERFSDDAAGGGHVMRWPDGKPEDAFFECAGNGCVIEHKHKREMIAGGEWRAAKPFKGHASFHIWAAYSYAPNSTWADIAKEFLAASKAGPQKLKTFVNTWLAQTWKERGEAPEWKRLYDRREDYEQATVPAGVVMLTAGVDVQRDRLIYEVVGWADDRQSWSIEAGVLPGDTANEGPDGPWPKLDELLGRTWPGVEGGVFGLAGLAIDSGDQTQTVYDWARRHPMPRVIAVKGVASAKAIIGSPTPVDIKANGKRVARGYKVWPVGSSIVKAELYGWLRLEAPTKESGASYPPGFCHFPEYGEDYFKELTAEHLVEIQKRNGYTVHEWQVLPGRQNHFLDCHVYARAAAALHGLDRMAAVRRKRAAAPTVKAPVQQPQEARVPEREPPRNRPPARAGWLGGGRSFLGSRGNWIGRR